MAVAGVVEASVKLTQGVLGFGASNKAYKEAERRKAEAKQSRVNIYNMQEKTIQDSNLRVLERNKTVQASTGFENTDFERVNEDIRAGQNLAADIRAETLKMDLATIDAQGPMKPSSSAAFLQAASNSLLFGAEIYDLKKKKDDD